MFATEQQIQELKDELESLKKEFNSDMIKKQAAISSVQSDAKFQLKPPLDVISKKVIKNISIFPVSVHLKSTEPATAANYTPFFIADRPMIVVAFTEVHGTAGTDGSDVTLQLERLQGTEAPDSGDELLSSALSLKATANTVQYGTLVNTDVIALKSGDRLCLKDSGTLTSVNSLVATTYLKLL